MSTEFDYKKARAEWAAPEYDALPESVKALFVRVVQESPNLYQVRASPVQFPEDGKLKQAFREVLGAVGQDVMNHAQAVVYYCGHWASGPNDFRPGGDQVAQAGAYWKFRDLAKVILIEAGFCAADKRWEESPDRPEFHPHKEGTEYTDEEVTELLKPLIKCPTFSGLEVRHINHRIKDHPSVQGHPFCIGTQHFPKDGGMYIDPGQAPCAMPGCGYGYKDHISDHVVLIKLVQPHSNKLSEEEAAALKATDVVLFMGQHKLDGFAFIK